MHGGDCHVAGISEMLHSVNSLTFELTKPHDENVLKGPTTNLLGYLFSLFQREAYLSTPTMAMRKTL